MTPNFTVDIDPSFSTSNISDIISATDAWTRATDGKATFGVKISDEALTGDEFGHIKIVNTIPPPGESGWCGWCPGKKSAKIEVKDTQDHFFSVVVHELGHSLNLNHDNSDAITIMHPWLQGDDHYIHCLDVQQFNLQWGFEAQTDCEE